MTAGEASRHRQRESLRLARSRVLQQLQLAQEPRYIKLLNDTLAHLDGQLTKLG